MINTQTLRTLIFHAQQNDLPVVSAAYFHGENENTSLLLNRLEVHGLLKTAMDIKFKEGMSFCGRFLRMYANGLGCTLIKRNVMEKIKFRYDPNQMMHPDSFFYEDLFLNDIPSYVDTGIILKHNSQNWNHNLDAYTKLK